MQNTCMAIIQVRDVPDDVQAELVRRAKAAGQSLQQYLRAMLVTQARRPEPSEFWSDVGRRAHESGASYELAEAADDVRAMRERDVER
jgi:plasmid stability protein